jgi:hypothetical protein
MVSPASGETAPRSFSLTFDYVGPEDKPFYRAQYGSSGPPASFPVDDPFRGYARLQAAGFDQVLAVLAEHGFSIRPDRQVDRGHPQYLLEIVSDGHYRYCNLGFDSDTYALLDAIRQVLPEAQRSPLDRVLDRLESALAARED